MYPAVTWYIVVLPHQEFFVLFFAGSAVSTSDKFFGVSGVVHRVRGMMTTNGEVYCKVRLEL